jgi:hypothetical protein
MKHICLMIVIASLAIGLSAPASAQYIWLDKNNVKHYSDTPPPKDIPNKRILKSPRGGMQAKNINESSSDSAAASNGSASTAKKQAPLSTAEKNADYNKRKMEQAEKNKKADEEKKRADAKAQNCARAREYQRTLNSGQRISRTNASGEREFISDEDRSRESAAANDALKECN